MMRGLLRAPAAGERVRLTGYHLAATGQHRGPSGLARWAVVACACALCASGSFAAVDEPCETGVRHVALCHLERVGSVPRAVDTANEVPPVKRY